MKNKWTVREASAEEIWDVLYGGRECLRKTTFEVGGCDKRGIERCVGGRIHTIYHESYLLRFDVYEADLVDELDSGEQLISYTERWIEVFLRGRSITERSEHSHGFAYLSEFNQKIEDLKAICEQAVLDPIFQNAKGHSDKLSWIWPAIKGNDTIEKLFKKVARADIQWFAQRLVKAKVVSEEDAYQPLKEGLLEYEFTYTKLRREVV